MYPLFFISKNNLRKKKGDVVVLLFLIALVAFLLYMSVSVLTGTEKVLNTAYENAHTADFLFLTNVDKEKEIEHIFTSQEEVTEYEVSECLYGVDTKYRKNQEEKESEITFLINKIGDDRNISKLTGIDTRKIKYNDIILPYYLKASEHYKEGDSFFLSLGGKEYEFRVAGFVEDPLFATPLNISIYSIYITEEQIEDILIQHSTLK